MHLHYPFHFPITALKIYFNIEDLHMDRQIGRVVGADVSPAMFLLCFSFYWYGLCYLHFSICEFRSDWMVFRSFKQIYDVMV